MTDASLLALPQSQFTRLVNAAFKSYGSLLELSRSPLAGSSLVTPALVLDEVAPTPDERGRALRVVLRWAVGRLAPAPPCYPLGRPRPFDDPAWTDPLWWPYNILRHRYLEPLRPDELEALHSPGFTDALMALSGIPGPDRLFGERNRAIQEVAGLPRAQLIDRQGDEELRRLAVEEVYQSLETHRAAGDLLGLAATFQGVFPRALLLEMAAAEGRPDAGATLEGLIGRRFLLEGDGGANLWMPSALQAYAYARQARPDLVRRHQRVAQFYREQGRPLQAAWHLRMGGQADEAAALLLASAAALVQAWQVEELRQALLAFSERDLPTARWCQVQIVLSDLFRKTGEREQALAACRRALKRTEEPARQARIYHRLGKLYEDHNQLHALGYYQQARERFPPDAPELIDLLTDRAWLYIHRREWEQAEADLTLALSYALGVDEELAWDTIEGPGFEGPASSAWHRRAGIYNAMASLYRGQEQYERAIFYAQKALFLREERGDRQHVADSYNNLGSIYAEMGALEQALESFEEALEIFGQLGNREAMATAQLNIGGTLYYTGRLPEAIERYHQSLAIFQEIGLPRGEAQARHNLAEALAEQGKTEEAGRHWREGYILSRQTGLADQVAWFGRLRQETPVLQAVDVPTREEIGDEPPPRHQDQPVLLPEEEIALEIAREHGRVTTKLLMEAAHVSKSTATRRLSGLTERGYLERTGRGRATGYIIPAEDQKKRPGP